MRRPCVLSGDDEPGLLNLFASLVERLHCETLRANGGQAALDILAHTVPDVLILDLAMPHISGMDVLLYILPQRRLDSLSIIVLTALGFTPEMHDVGDRIERWISRPVSPNDFMQAVQGVLDRRN